jgi:hypothetical protein
MGDLLVSSVILTEEGSQNFKQKIELKRERIENYDVVDLQTELRGLTFRESEMNQNIEYGGFAPTMHTSQMDFTEHGKIVYKMYRDAVSNLIKRVKDRLIELGAAAGIRKKKQTMRKSKNKSKRRRKSRKFK